MKHLAILTVLCLTTAHLQAQDSGSALSLGQQALRARLERDHPGVTQWDIVPLQPAAPAAMQPLAGELTAFVTRLGVRSAVWVTPKSTSRPARGELIWYSVAGFGPAVVTTRRLASGTALEMRDGTLGSSDLVAAGCTGLTSPQALDGMRTKVTIEAGAMICAGAIEAMPPVTRGEEVTVRYLTGALSLTAHAVAQADGLLGKPVLVRSTASGELFRAVVSAREEVSVND